MLGHKSILGTEKSRSGYQASTSSLDQAQSLLEGQTRKTTKPQTTKPQTNGLLGLRASRSAFSWPTGLGFRSIDRSVADAKTDSGTKPTLMRSCSSSLVPLGNLSDLDASISVTHKGRHHRLKFLTSFASNSFNSASGDINETTRPALAVNDLAALETRMAQVVECQKVDAMDSTTGAHVGLNAAQDSVFIIKSNSESHFELIGNCFAEVLGLNMPGFALLSEDFNQYDRFKGLLDSKNEFPFIVSEYKCAINLKEVTPDQDTLDEKSLFRELGKAYLMDWIIGNWDRFPVFENDSEGNFGNVMYEPSEKRLLFIDTVAQKHTEIGNYGAKEYLNLSDEQLNAVMLRINHWLEDKFPALSVVSPMDAFEDFKAGIKQGLVKLSAEQASLSELLSLQSEQLNSFKTGLELRLPTILSKLSLSIKGHLSQVPSTKQPSDEDGLASVVRAMDAIADLTLQDKDALTKRIEKNQPLPRFGSMAKKVHGCPAFMSCWQAYQKVQAKSASEKKLALIVQSIDQNENSCDVEKLLEDLKIAGFQSEDTVALSHHYEMSEEINLQIKKLNDLTTFFAKVLDQYQQGKFVTL